LLEEEGADGLLPGEIDELFVGLDRVGDARRGHEEQGKERYRLEKRGAAWERNCVAPEVVFRVRFSTIYREGGAKKRA
jgi:hypothetical protein